MEKLMGGGGYVYTPPKSLYYLTGYGVYNQIPPKSMGYKHKVT